MNEEPIQLTIQPDDVSIIVRPGETVLQAMSAAGLGYRTGYTRRGVQHRSSGGYDPNLVHFPSETTSTDPSTTMMAVCSSMA